jgi:hypothetical protein
LDADLRRFTLIRMVDGVEYKHVEITKLIIQGFYSVYNTLGYGFLEKVYRKALFNGLNHNQVK